MDDSDSSEKNSLLDMYAENDPANDNSDSDTSFNKACSAYCKKKSPPPYYSPHLTDMSESDSMSESECDTLVRKDYNADSDNAEYFDPLFPNTIVTIAHTYRRRIALLFQNFHFLTYH